MKPPLRLTMIAVIATLIVAGLSAAQWSGSADLDFWNVPTLKAEIADENRVAEELIVHGEQVMRRIAAKDAVVADLSACRIGLIDAAAQFRVLNAGSPSIATVVSAMYPNMSDDERVCRNVIAFAESNNRSGRALGLRLRLELFVFKVLGRLRLPDLPLEADDEPVGLSARVNR